MDAPKQKRTGEVESEPHDALSPNPTAANERTGEAGGGFSSPSTSTTTPRPQAPSPSPASAVLADHLPEEEPGTGGAAAADKQRPREPSSSSSADLHARSARALPPFLHTAQNDPSKRLDSLSAPETATEAMTGPEEILAHITRNVNLAIEPQQQSGRRGWSPWGGALTSQSHSRGAEATVMDSGGSETSNSGGAEIRDVGPGGAGTGERGEGRHVFGNGDKNKGFQGAESSSGAETAEVAPVGEETGERGEGRGGYAFGNGEEAMGFLDAVNWAVGAEQEEAAAFYQDEGHYDYYDWYLMDLHPEVLMMGHQDAIASHAFVPYFYPMIPTVPYIHPAVAHFCAPAHYYGVPNWTWVPASSSTHHYLPPPAYYPAVPNSWASASSSTHNNFGAPAHNSNAPNRAPASSSTHNNSRAPAHYSAHNSNAPNRAPASSSTHNNSRAPASSSTHNNFRAPAHCSAAPNRAPASSSTHHPALGDDRRTATDVIRRKTKVCDQWRVNGACSFGDKCNFAHGIAECRYGVNCRSGENCKFLH